MQEGRGAHEELRRVSGKEGMKGQAESRESTPSWDCRRSISKRQWSTCQGLPSVKKSEDQGDSVG